MRSGLAAGGVTVTNRSVAKAATLAGLTGVASIALEEHPTGNTDAASSADIVLIGVKPAMVPDLLREIAPVLRPGTIVVSLAAGVTIATFESIRLIKKNLPGALTHLGLSNCSFGLSPYTRQVVNSVYLHYALEYGLDSAILHASKILPLAQIDEKGKELARRLLFDERVFDAAGNCVEDPLQMLIEHYADKKTEAKKKQSLGDTVEERLRQAIIQGRRETLIADRDFHRILPLLDRLRTLPTGYATRDVATPWTASYGLSQRERLQSATQESYHQALERLLRSRIIFRLEEQLEANVNNPGFIYEALKVYLMVGGRAPLDRQRGGGAWPAHLAAGPPLP